MHGETLKFKNDGSYFLSITKISNVIQHPLLLLMLYMFQAVFPPIIWSSKTVHAASGIFQAYLLLPLAWVSFQLIHASSSNKQACHIPDLCVQFLSS